RHGDYEDRCVLVFFFFQAEDGIRDWSVTGVQTCALPIWGGADRLGKGGRLRRCARREIDGKRPQYTPGYRSRICEAGRERCGNEIGRASCRGRGEKSGGGGVLKKKKCEKRVTAAKAEQRR